MRYHDSQVIRRRTGIPLTGLLGKVDFSNSYIVLKGAVPEAVALSEARKIAGVVVLGYGQFLSVLVNTLILALVVFMVVRAVTNLRLKIRREEMAVPTPAAAAPADIVLLGEIRDLLKTRAP